MSELIKAIETRYTAFKTERARKFDAKREIVSSDNFFLFMNDIYTKKISGRKVDELGNIAKANRIEFKPENPIFKTTYGSKLKVIQPIPTGENLGINTIFIWDPINEKEVINTYVSVGHIDKSDTPEGHRISSLSKFEIKKDLKTSGKLVYELGYYDSNDNSFGLTEHMDILKPELFPNVVGRAFEIAFNLFERKGVQKPLSPLAAEMTPFSSGDHKKLEGEQKALIAENF